MQLSKWSLTTTIEKRARGGASTHGTGVEAQQLLRQWGVDNALCQRLENAGLLPDLASEWRTVFEVFRIAQDASHEAAAADDRALAGLPQE